MNFTKICPIFKTFSSITVSFRWGVKLPSFCLHLYKGNFNAIDTLGQICSLKDLNNTFFENIYINILMSCSKGGMKKSFYHNLVNTLSILLAHFGMVEWDKAILADKIPHFSATWDNGFYWCTVKIWNPYKTVRWTLITSCYKELMDSLTKWLTLYGCFFYVTIFLCISIWKFFLLETLLDIFLIHLCVIISDVYLASVYINLNSKSFYYNKLVCFCIWNRYIF